VRGTHILEGAEGGTSQEDERQRASDTHLLESTRTETNQESVRKRERGTHFLENAKKVRGKSGTEGQKENE
jgi:hypothetical protein